MEEETVKVDSLNSAAAFVEGGIQDACEDACSICLEDFCDSDPSSVTECKHEYHLQCILEWCQRSSRCPMCWQPLSLKDPTSQELLEGVVKERAIRQNPPRNTTIFRHPTLGNFELQHLPDGANDADLEEQIIQHLAAATGMGRAHISRRDGHRGRTRGHGRPQYLVFSAHPSSPSVEPVSATSSQTDGEHNQPLSIPIAVGGDSTPPHHTTPTHTINFLSSSSGQTTAVNQERAGPSDFQVLSESIKTRFNAASTRYKESIIKSTRGWRDRLFSRNQSTPSDTPSEVQRNDTAATSGAGIETISNMTHQLHPDENSSNSTAATFVIPEMHSSTPPRSEIATMVGTAQSSSNSTPATSVIHTRQMYPSTPSMSETTTMTTTQSQAGDIEDDEGKNNHPESSSSSALLSKVEE
ncbi:E3 ubiquitin-protein ligase RHF2A [Zostera marina]|uniref:RING-type E3 ubiquitin transferase n=1 Tax=Zostera marina TaxID=29655 RepID=A0A0K9PEQ6_ZOSMR|nr:E3 ubiquitin-protein ligase RHF2A [Zostera marina]